MIEQDAAATRGCGLGFHRWHPAFEKWPAKYQILCRARDIGGRKPYKCAGTVEDTTHGRTCPRGNRIRRGFHQGSQGPRGGAQAPWHVHRRHRRRLGPASHGLRGRGQRDRRGAGRPRHRRERQNPRRQQRLGPRQRPRDPRRNPQGGRRLRGRGHHDPASRGRKVRPELLQGLRRSPRRGGVGRQRAFGVA